MAAGKGRFVGGGAWMEWRGSSAEGGWWCVRFCNGKGGAEKEEGRETGRDVGTAGTDRGALKGVLQIRCGGGALG